MDEFVSAETIGKKARALKHCRKLIEKIDKNGQAIVALNCTGVQFVVHKGDALYLKIVTTRAQLTEDINSYEIVKRTKVEEKNKRHYPAPIGAAPLSEVEIEKKRAKAREYNQRYYAKQKAKNVNLTN